MEFRLDDPSYEFAARAALPNLRAALAGTLPVPPHAPDAEAWLALAMYFDDTARPGFAQDLEDILSGAEYIKDEMPSWPEVAGAFVRLRKRGWLVEQGDRWGITRQARTELDEIVTSNMVGQALGDLEGWLKGHPLSP